MVNDANDQRADKAFARPSGDPRTHVSSTDSVPTSRYQQPAVHGLRSSRRGNGPHAVLTRIHNATGQLINQQSHQGTLIFVDSGLLIIDVDSVRYFIGRHLACWIPPGRRYATRARSPSSGWSLKVTPTVAAQLSSRTLSLQSNRQMELLLEGKPTASAAGRPDPAWLQRVCEGACHLNPTNCILPWPTSCELGAVAKALDRSDDPLSGATDIVKLCGFTPRAFERQFRKETGITFDEWRYRLSNFRALNSLYDQTPTLRTRRIGYEVPDCLSRQWTR